MTNFSAIPKFPNIRMRRIRQKSWLRALVSEQTLSVSDLILPIFVTEGKNLSQPIKSMPGINSLTVDLIPDVAKSASNIGIPVVAIFPRIDPEKKTPLAKEALNPDNLVCRAVASIREAGIDIGTLCDVALDPYSSIGHDGIVVEGNILNDETIEILCQQALIQAKAGFDIIAPSDMMDGRIGRIRSILDSNSFHDIPIMAYAAKYASNLYGPFREAVDSARVLEGDKKSYQMDPANSDEAMREVALDISEGADMIIIKPGLPYLDIVQRVKSTFQMPTFAYNVSGEYAMLRAAAQNDWLNYEKVLIEILIAFKRAGADGILTYSAMDAAKLLQNS